MKIRTTLIMAVVACASVSMSAQQTSSDEMSTHYTKFQSTPDRLVTSGQAVYTTWGNTFGSITGKEFKKVGKGLLDADVNPYANMFFLIGTDGKQKNEAIIIANEAEAEILYKVNRKKMGNPSAAAYTADALHILLATDSALYVLNAPDRKVVDSFKIPFAAVDMMLPSSNGYFLALASGSKLAVYNLEEKTLRKEWNFEVKINDMTFNDNNTELAVTNADGQLVIFDTKNFLVKKTIDDLGDALACSYNLDGKYIAVAETPSKIEVINLLSPSDRETIEVPGNTLSTLRFTSTGSNNAPVLTYNDYNSIWIRPMGHLTPYYARLINDEATEKLNEWLKMMPDETMEQYRERISDENRRKQKQLFEDEISTRLAPDMLSMATLSLGKYDRANGVLEVDFNNMPSIFLPVPESDLGAFGNSGDLTFNNARYGVQSDDSFELIYAEVTNAKNGKTYIYDNIERVPLNYMQGEDNSVSIDLILQQQMEEQKLQELKEEIIAEAKSQNVISDHTKITVDTRIDPDYDANGKKILNYRVYFTYEVDPGFTAVEDFGPGKYHAEQSGAAGAMLSLVKTALEGEFAQYVKEGKKLNISLSGTADATPIVSKIIYDGGFGDIVEVPVYKNGNIEPMTLHPNSQITQNEQLAFLRAYGVKNYLESNINKLNDMNTSYRYNINVADGKGSEYRRITVEFTFADAF